MSLTLHVFSRTCCCFPATGMNRKILYTRRSKFLTAPDEQEHPRRFWRFDLLLWNECTDRQEISVLLSEAWEIGVLVSGAWEMNSIRFPDSDCFLWDVLRNLKFSSHQEDRDK